MALTAPAQAILDYLVTQLPNITAGEPQGYVPYKVIHDALRLDRMKETWGDSLKVQGLEEVANWTRDNGFPAITGLVVSKESLSPGKGYFSVYDKTEFDFEWWKEEIQKSMEFDWSAYTSITDAAIIAADIEESGRTETTVYRILRDTSISARIKKLYDFQCQLCGETVLISKGRRYAEVHHIQPLGAPHNGPDIEGNMICLCPNHHAQLDFGGIELDIQMITMVSGHQLETKYLEYHNNNIFGE